MIVISGDYKQRIIKDRDRLGKQNFRVGQIVQFRLQVGATWMEALKGLNRSPLAVTRARSALTKRFNITEEELKEILEATD